MRKTAFVLLALAIAASSSPAHAKKIRTGGIGNSGCTAGQLQDPQGWGSCPQRVDNGLLNGGHQWYLVCFEDGTKGCCSDQGTARVCASPTAKVIPDVTGGPPLGQAPMMSPR